MELEVQKFLRNKNNKVEDLTSKYALIIKRHKEFPNLVLFKYDSIESPMAIKLCQEARGLILNEADNWNIVAFPYTKFFNYGENLAAHLGKEKRVYEKLDGSLIILYYYNNEWQVATSGTPDASGEVKGFNFSFKDLFWKVFNEIEYSVPSEKYKQYTFMLELCTPYNKIVVQHKENKLVLHGVRNNETMKEEYPELFAKELGFDCVKSYDYKTVDELETSNEITSLSPIEFEGFVVVDENFNRIKVKSPKYISLSHIRDSFSERRVVELIQNGEKSEFLAYFPEYTSLFEKIKELYENYIASIEKVYLSIKDIPDQKEFALKAIKYPFSGALFTLRKKKDLLAKDIMKEVPAKKVLEMIGVKEKAYSEAEQ